MGPLRANGPRNERVSTLACGVSRLRILAQIMACQVGTKLRYRKRAPVHQRTNTLVFKTEASLHHDHADARIGHGPKRIWNPGCATDSERSSMCDRVCRGANTSEHGVQSVDPPSLRSPSSGHRRRLLTAAAPAFWAGLVRHRARDHARAASDGAGRPA